MTPKMHSQISYYNKTDHKWLEEAQETAQEEAQEDEDHRQTQIMTSLGYLAYLLKE